MFHSSWLEFPAPCGCGPWLWAAGCGAAAKHSRSRPPGRGGRTPFKLRSWQSGIISWQSGIRSWLASTPQREERQGHREVEGGHYKASVHQLLIPDCREIIPDCREMSLCVFVLALLLRLVFIVIKCWRRASRNWGTFKHNKDNIETNEHTIKIQTM